MDELNSQTPKGSGLLAKIQALQAQQEVPSATEQQIFSSPNSAPEQTGTDLDLDSTPTSDTETDLGFDLPDFDSAPDAASTSGTDLDLDTDPFAVSDSSDTSGTDLNLDSDSLSEPVGTDLDLDFDDASSDNSETLLGTFSSTPEPDDTSDSVSQDFSEDSIYPAPEIPDTAFFENDTSSSGTDLDLDSDSFDTSGTDLDFDSDSTSDTGTDLGFDLPDFDSAPDAVSDAASTTGTDLDLDTDSFAASDSSSTTGTDLNLDSDSTSDTGTDLNFDLPDFDSAPDAVSDAASTSGTDLDLDTDPFAASDSSSTTGTDLNLDSDSTSDTGTDLDFDSPSFDAAPSSSAGLSFTGLYDKETIMGDSSDQSEQVRKKTKLPVIICVICAVICLIATTLILFIIPSKYNLITKKTVPVDDNTVIIETESSNPENKTAPDQSENLKVAEQSDVPPAKENEVVVIEQAEEVVPVPPVVNKQTTKAVQYKIKWGDTLWDIANTYYRNPWKYKNIAAYNKIANPDHIISGTTITIPAE